MFRHILVPVDGTKTSEISVYYAVEIAKQAKASITLVHVLEPATKETVHGEHHIKSAGEAEGYLVELRSRAIPSGIAVAHHVHTEDGGDLSEGLASEIKKFDVDLVCMHTYGERHFLDFFKGNLAQRVLSKSHCPVLLLKDGTDNPNFSKIAIALDADMTHDTSITFGTELGKLFNSRIYLISVAEIPVSPVAEEALFTKYTPRVTKELLKVEEEHLKKYLDLKKSEITRHNLTVETMVVEGDSLDEIITTTKKIGANCVILSTHARTGAAALWAGHVAPKISAHPHLPLFLVPARD